MNELKIDCDYLFVDNECINTIFEKIQGSNNFFEWLVSSLCVENIGELHYIMELVERKVSCNFPLLVCGDDLDFSCTIVVVKVEWLGDKVIWTKFGTVKREVDYWDKYRSSGILRFEDWTDDDWQKYGSIAYELISDESFFDEWCSENWNEEVYRRTCGYYHDYLNYDINIEWIGEVDFQFDSNKYQECFLNGLS